MAKLTNLVMVGKWNNWSTNTQNQWWMDFTVSVSVRISLNRVDPCLYKILVYFKRILSFCKLPSAYQIDLLFTHTNCHGNHGSFLFFSVYVFNESFCYKIVPTTIFWGFLLQEIIYNVGNSFHFSTEQNFHWYNEKLVQLGSVSTPKHLN